MSQTNHHTGAVRVSPGEAVATALVETPKEYHLEVRAGWPDRGGHNKRNHVREVTRKPIPSK